MKRILYFYGSLLWSFVQAFAFGCLIWTLNEYIFSNPNPKDQGDIVAVVIMSLILLACVVIDSKIRKYYGWNMLLLSALVSPVRFIFQIITIVKFHQTGNSKDFAPRGGFYTGNFSSWAMYVLFSTVSLSPNRQYTPPQKPTNSPHHAGSRHKPHFEYDPFESSIKKKPSSSSSSYSSPKSQDVYSEEYQSQYYSCKDCQYYTTYKKQVDGFLIQSVNQGWCTRDGHETEDFRGPCFKFKKK